MQEITKKLFQKTLDEFYPIAETLAAKGYDPDRIALAFQKLIKSRSERFYDDSMKSVREILRESFENLQNADSKVEAIFFRMLKESGLDFKFQYSIGPYRADYLFSGFLVVELDGPDHTKEHDQKRDEYMRKMGYKIIRVPLWILVSDPYAVIEEIREVIKSVEKRKEALRAKKIIQLKEAKEIKIQEKLIKSLKD